MSSVGMASYDIAPAGSYIFTRRVSPFLLLTMTLPSSLPMELTLSLALVKPERSKFSTENWAPNYLIRPLLRPVRWAVIRPYAHLCPYAGDGGIVGGPAIALGPGDSYVQLRCD